MDSHDVWRKLRAEHNTVQELEDQRQAYSDELNNIGNIIGEEGLQKLKEKEKAEKRWDDPRPTFTDQEKEYMHLEAVLEVFDNAIEERQKLDSVLIQPNEFKGIIDVEASAAERPVIGKPLHKRIKLREPYKEFFSGIKKLRQKLGREEISQDEAENVAKQLEKAAGLKGVVVADNEDRTGFKAILSKIEDELDILNNILPYTSTSEGRDQVRSEFYRFFIPIQNGLNLKPIPPVEQKFDVAVSKILRALPSAVVGKEPEFHESRERRSVSEARQGLASKAAQDPALRKAVEAFLEAHENSLREEDNLVLTRPEPQQEAADSKPARRKVPG